MISSTTAISRHLSLIISWFTPSGPLGMGWEGIVYLLHHTPHVLPRIAKYKPIQPSLIKQKKIKQEEPQTPNEKLRHCSCRSCNLKYSVHTERCKINAQPNEFSQSSHPCNQQINRHYQCLERPLPSLSPSSHFAHQK